MHISRSSRACGQLVALAAVMTVLACEKAQSKPPTQNAKTAETPAAMPDSLLLLAELPEASKLNQVLSWLDALQPGASFMARTALTSMLPQSVGATALTGAELDRPIRLLLLDPRRYPRPALLVSTRDPGQLKRSAAPALVEVHGTSALVGDAGTIAALHAYALTNLARQPAPATPRITVLPRRWIALYRSEIEAGFAALRNLQLPAGPDGKAPPAGFGALLAEMLSLYLAAAEQTDELSLSLVNDEGAGLEMHVLPRPGSTLAGFCAAQKPSTFQLLEQLPAGDAALVYVGNTVLGPARASLLALGDKIGQAFYNTTFTALLGPERYHAWLDLFTGDFASQFWLRGPEQLEGVYLIGTTDSARALEGSSHMMGQLADAMKKGVPLAALGVHTQLRYRPTSFVHRAVPVAQADTTVAVPQAPTGSTSMRMHLAALPGAMAVTLGERSDVQMRGLIDATRGGATGFTPGSNLASALAAARKRGDSALMFMDLGTLMRSAAPAGGATGPGEVPPALRALIISVRFTARDMHMRFTMPLVGK
jgi:hypothetical protein